MPAASVQHTSAEVLIDCQDLVKVYGDGGNAVTVLSGVSLRVCRGEFVSIVGPSGSGKSTLMHILGGLDTPTSGTYTLDAQLVSSLDDEQLAAIRNRKIGFVFQSFNLQARTSVARNVMLPLLYNPAVPVSERMTKVRAAVVAAGLSESNLSNKSNQLSGGQMQRVAIARALVNDPSIILADEPTGNLDQATGKIVIDTFLRLNRSGKTIVLITHDLTVAHHAARIISLRDGKIISDQPNHDRQLAGAVN